MAGPIFRSPPIHVESGASPDFHRADIVFDGVDQSGLSYEARVFLNNPAAGLDTEKSSDNGYAGAFHVYGEGRPAAPPAPTTRYVTATEAVRRSLRQGPDLTVTVVAVPYGRPGRRPVVDLIIDRVSIVIDMLPG
jgi:hypothetical protein